jgi:hypothetical protein
MTRGVILAILCLLFFNIGPLQSSSVRGHYREPRLKNEKRGRLHAGETYEFRDTFRANQRACVIVEGDHNPPVNLTVKVFDVGGNQVAADSGGGDFVAVMWYPPRAQEYRIRITSNGNDYNDLDIVVK